MVVLIDASGSIKKAKGGELNWDKVKNFTLQLVQSLDVGPNATHFSVIVYSYRYLNMWYNVLIQGRDSQKVLSLRQFFFAYTSLKVMTFVLAKICLKLGFTKCAYQNLS